MGRRIRGPTQRKRGRFLARIRGYFQESSIHGFRYLLYDRITPIERLCWLLILLLALFILISMSLKSWQRYQTRSTVISVDRNYCFWNTTFPSTTICPLKRLDRNRFNEYISERDHHPFDEQQIHHLFEFLESLANSTYNTLKYLHTTQDIDELLAYFNIKPENYLSLIYNLTVDRSLKDINDVDNPAKIRATSGLQVVNSRLILTEFGLCYLFNSKLSSEYSANYMIRGGELQSMIDNLSQSDKYIGTRASNFFASVNNYNILGLDSGTALYVYIHSPYDIMTREKSLGYIDDSYTVMVQTNEIIADENIHDLSMERRLCRFQHENNLQHFPIYTQKLCLSECRLELVHKVCNCIPHFYMNHGNSLKRTCDYRILMDCVAKNKDQFLNLYFDEEEAGPQLTCTCLPNCEDSFTSIRSKQSGLASMNVMTGGHSVLVYMEKLPNYRYKRTIIYTTTEWLISLGSTASLFMGICVLNLLESLYHFTLRWIFS